MGRKDSASNRPVEQSSTPGETNLSLDSPFFQRRKLNLTLIIMGIGMLIAIAWHLTEALSGKGYPYNTFLFIPEARFGDYTDGLIISNWTNPYIDPYAPLLPFAWILMRGLSLFPPSFGLITFLFATVGALYLLLERTLRAVVFDPWRRAFVSLLFLALSYPVLFCVDRGNIELLVALLVAASIYLFAQKKYFAGVLCLIPIISIKLYPALFLVIPLRQVKTKPIITAVGGFLFLILGSLVLLKLPFGLAEASYARNMQFFTHVNFYQNYDLEGSASLWNPYKILLIIMGDIGLISPVDFSFDGSFIRLSYEVFSGCSVVFALALVLYVCFIEKEYLRCAIVLCLYLASCTPTGADYRLLYANIAAVLLVLLKTRRPHDLMVLVFLALILVPKKEIILGFAGRTETGFTDVSIQVLFNAILVFVSLCLILYDGFGRLDLRWSQLRWARYGRMLRWQRASANPSTLTDE